MLKVCKYEVQNKKQTKKKNSTQLDKPSSVSVANFLLQVKNSNGFSSTSKASLTYL